jgi:hypothetical protein
LKKKRKDIIEKIKEQARLNLCLHNLHEGYFYDDERVRRKQLAIEMDPTRSELSE